MIHPTFRRLDEPATLFGYSLGQLAALTVLGAVVFGVVHATQMAPKPALTTIAFTVGLPAMLARLGEHTATSVRRLALDAARALRQPARLPAGPGSQSAGYVIQPPDDPREQLRTGQPQTRSGSAPRETGS